MPIYEYKCSSCQHEFEKMLSFADFNKKIKCEKCKAKANRQMPTGILGGSTAEPWEYDFTHSAKPKFVKDSEGNRHKFDPTKHTKGRKGQG
jgi:putative FmdB family regulatory protein